MPSISFKKDECRAVRSVVYDWLTQLRDAEGELEERQERGEDEREVREGLAHVRERIQWVEGIARKFDRVIYQ